MDPYTFHTSGGPTGDSLDGMMMEGSGELSGQHPLPPSADDFSMYKPKQGYSDSGYYPYAATPGANAGVDEYHMGYPPAQPTAMAPSTVQVGGPAPAQYSQQPRTEMGGYVPGVGLPDAPLHPQQQQQQQQQEQRFYAGSAGGPFAGATLNPAAFSHSNQDDEDDDEEQQMEAPARSSGRRSSTRGKAAGSAKRVKRKTEPVSLGSTASSSNQGDDKQQPEDEEERVARLRDNSRRYRQRKKNRMVEMERRVKVLEDERLMLLEENKRVKDMLVRASFGITQTVTNNDEDGQLRQELYCVAADRSATDERIKGVLHRIMLKHMRTSQRMHLAAHEVDDLCTSIRRKEAWGCPLPASLHPQGTTLEYMYQFCCRSPELALSKEQSTSMGNTVQMLSARMRSMTHERVRMAEILQGILEGSDLERDYLAVARLSTVSAQLQHLIEAEWDEWERCLITMMEAMTPRQRIICIAKDEASKRSPCTELHGEEEEEE